MSPAELERIDAHLDDCVECRDVVDAVIADEPDAVSNGHITTFHGGFVVADRYEIKEFVGKGGMGEVYSAVDQMTGGLVALKTVLCTASDDARAVRKLLDEVVNAQRLSHPHVFKIYDLHVHRDAQRGRVPFFTMEFIEGESLGARLKRERALPVAEAKVVARQLLSGLSAAHAKGVLHLDFKSDNVMLRRVGGEAVIMDFGLSRASDRESRERTSERLQGAGTLPYMSMEQIECRSDIGLASDVYSFGVVLYEMLTGRLPFEGDSFAAILLKQVRQRPAPPSNFVSISPQLEAFVLKCLARCARDRYPDAARALAALDEVTSWERPSGAAHGRRTRGLLALSAITAAAALGFGAVLADSQPTERGPGTESVVRMELSPARAESTGTTKAPPSLLEHTEAEDSRPAAAERDIVRTSPDTVGRSRVRSRRTTTPPAPKVELSPTVAPEKPPVPPDWRGPPPKQIPKPRPL